MSPQLGNVREKGGKGFFFKKSMYFNFLCDQLPKSLLPSWLGSTARLVLLTLAAGLWGLELSHHKFLSSRNPAWERKETRRRIFD